MLLMMTTMVLLLFFFVFASGLAMPMHILGKSDQNLRMIVLHEMQTTSGSTAGSR